MMAFAGTLDWRDIWFSREAEKSVKNVRNPTLFSPIDKLAKHIILIS